MKNLRRAIAAVLMICMVISCLPGLSVQAAGAASITELTCDYLTEPLGIDNTTPQFSWKMQSGARGQYQTHYQIVVATTEEQAAAGTGNMWDTGKVESGISVGIPYEGAALQSATRYYWAVTVWNQDGETLQSDVSWFEMGLLDQQNDWEAQFIAPNKEQKTVGAYTIEFDFQIKQDGAGFVFGQSGSSFLMWQINTFDFQEQEKVYFRPHKWTNGAPAVIVEQDISHVIPWAERKDLHSMKIEVSETCEIKTYVDDQLIDTRTDPQAAFGLMGFREVQSTEVAEAAWFDNLTVTDTTTSEVLYQNDFSQHMRPFSAGTLENGMLLQETISGDICTADLLRVEEEAAPMFRKTFTVDSTKELASARLYATALGVYEAYLNGKKVGVDKLAPGWTDYTEYVQYQTFDITDQLVPGANAIGAIVGEGWYTGHVSTGGGNYDKYGVDVAFLGQIVLTYTDDSQEIIGTDDSWKCTFSGPYLATDNQDGETYDARREIPGWDTASFDDTGWMNTKIATKDTIDTKVDVENIGLVAQSDEPVQVTEELETIEVTEPEEGVYIFDLGQNIAGWARLKVTGEEGTTVRLRFGEMLENDGTLYTANLRTAKATDYYTLKGDPNGEVYEPCFTFHGFRYVEVTGYPGVPTAEDITGVVVSSGIERSGDIETSNALVNQLYSNILWGQRDNYLSVPTDCPQRDERLGWTGDAQVFARTGALNFDINPFFTKYLRDVNTAQLDNGAIFDIAPRQGHAVGSGNAGWGDVAVIGPWTMYTAYGDTQVIEDCYQMMQDWIAYCQTNSTDLIRPADAYGDWLSIGESTPKDMIATAYFAYSTSLLAKMAAVIGKTEDAAAYEQLFNDIRAAFNEKFVDPTTGVVKGNSQTAYLLALKFDLLPTEELRQKAGENLIARLEANNWHLTTGFLGVSYLCPVLSEMGYNEVAYQLLLNQTYPSWLYSVVNGATTIWERWNSYVAETGTFGDVGMNSFNHYSYGSIGEWMYQYAAGIMFDENAPGYKHFFLQPMPSTQMDHVRGSYDSMYGEIVSDWTLQNEVFSLSVTVPANTTATLYLPCDDAASVQVDGAAYVPGETQVEGVTYTGQEDRTLVMELASGTYTFETTVKEVNNLQVSAAESSEGATKATITIDGKESGYTTVVDGQQVTVEAQPVNDLEYVFDHWSGDVESTENPLTLTTEGSMELYANFRYVGYTNLALGKTATASSNDGGAPTWSTSNLTDGVYIGTSEKSGYTSKGHDSQENSEWVVLDLGQDTTFNTIHLYPRTDSFTASGATASFPIDFTIEVAAAAAPDSFTPIVTETGYTAPYCKPAAFDVGSQTARYIKVSATLLGDMAGDDTVYRLQLAEIGVYNKQEKDSYTLTLNQEGVGAVRVNGETVTLPYTGTFSKNALVTVEAVETEQLSQFYQWTGSIASMEPAMKLVMNEDKALTAVFADPARVNHALGGTVTASDGISIAPDWGNELLTDGKTASGTGYSSNFLEEYCDVTLDVDLGENTLIDTVVLYPRNDGKTTDNGQTPSYPVDFEIQIREDGSDTFQTVKTVTDEPNPMSKPQTYTLDQPVMGRTLRIHVTRIGDQETSDGGRRFQLTELEAYNKQYPLEIAFANGSSLEVDDTMQTALQAKLLNGSTLDLPADLVEYESSVTAVATVDGTGVVTGIAAGETVLTAKATINGIVYEAQCTLRVEEPQILTYAIVTAETVNGTLTTDAASAAEGETITITATPDEGYRLKEGSLKVYKTGEETTTVSVDGCTFAMPAYDVTVTAEFEAIPVHVHQYDQENTDAGYLKTAATCTEAAVYYKSCACGEASDTDTFTSGAPLGHDYGQWTVTKEAGCTEDGTKTRVCSHDSSHVETERIPALGHDYADDWSHDETSHWHACSRCDAITDQANHSGGTATYTEQAVCEVCGASYGDLLTRPSGGGSSSGNKTEITTNPDGSTTTTVTKPDGSKTENTKAPDGSSSVVNTDKDGLVSATVAVSSSALENAEEAIALPMPAMTVPANDAQAPTVKVDLPAGTTARVEIPVANVTAGTVAVLVKADGTEEIIRTSVATEDGVVLKVEDGDTVKIMDNTKTFADVADDFWGVDAVTFAASRELFNGVSTDTFAPNNTMNRAMIVTVLARLDGVDTSGTVWYEAGREWAMEQNISDGSNMMGSLTREQLAVMLYRYAGSPAVSGTVTGFVDTDSISDWAEDAMLWAVQNGILTGSGNNLNPQGNATRAQVAAMLMRFCEKIA